MPATQEPVLPVTLGYIAPLEGNLFTCVLVLDDGFRFAGYVLLTEPAKVGSRLQIRKKVIRNRQLLDAHYYVQA